MATGNPALSESYFEQESYSGDRGAVMTVQGAAIKTLILTSIMVAVAGFTWGMVFPSGVSAAHSSVRSGGASMNGLEINRQAMIGCMAGGAIGGLILGLIMCFRPKAAPVLAPIYAVCEGLFVGAISGVYAVNQYPGIVLNATLLTVGVLVTMLTLYASRIIVMSDKLRTGIIAATGAVCLVYLVSMVLNMCGIRMPYIHDAGPIGIGISAVVIIIAAMNLVLDFDTIEQGARYGAPKYMEWYAAYGLLVTLVWLYLEILRLLSKLNRSNE
jgi:uncharacterized YccA/Bax inhibitor family protein